ncbi:MAG: hypothetical protein IPQ07_44680 [Myxococcales bacterium]|nr:hypothetical protein [Myxococcales bacterium]
MRKLLPASRHREGPEADHPDAGGVEKLAMETNRWLLSGVRREPAAAARQGDRTPRPQQGVRDRGAANFTTSYGDGGYLLLASDRARRRGDARGADHSSSRIWI